MNFTEKWTNAQHYIWISCGILKMKEKLKYYKITAAYLGYIYIFYYMSLELWILSLSNIICFITVRAQQQQHCTAKDQGRNHKPITGTNDGLMRERLLITVGNIYAVFSKGFPKNFKFFRIFLKNWKTEK